MSIGKASKQFGLAAALCIAYAATACAQAPNNDFNFNGANFMQGYGAPPGNQPETLRLTQYADPRPAVDDRTVADTMQSVGDCERNAWTIEYALGYESFRGVSDGSWMNNGIVNGLNFGSSLGPVSDYTGIGFQMGGLFGIYDWSVADYRMRDQDQAETQAFFTAGFFRKPTEQSPYSAAVVYDVMLNNNFSVYAQSPTLSQWRGLVGYEWDDRNEFGLWGTLRDGSANWNVPGAGPVTWRSVNEASFFWHHKWSYYGADTMVSVGMPEQDRLIDGGSLGDYIVGALAKVPLNDFVNLVSQVTYMHPSAKPGPAASDEDAWTFYIGLTFFPRYDARTRSVANEGWSPLLPVCDNGTFIVDASNYY